MTRMQSNVAKSLGQGLQPILMPLCILKMIYRLESLRILVNFFWETSEARDR